ncbi:unnamed protein product [Protopolystoma xenopodis]|uniref:Uncharacterized protein n=1 Tax=Protopolystoma xenopodis TaxID=117903 RepID=A0A3S5A7K5_9PLAT|nr:unnamed protein product [Protopolystoma xenopodis]
MSTVDQVNNVESEALPSFGWRPSVLLLSSLDGSQHLSGLLLAQFAIELCRLANYSSVYSQTPHEPTDAPPVTSTEGVSAFVPMSTEDRSNYESVFDTKEMEERLDRLLEKEEADLAARRFLSSVRLSILPVPDPDLTAKTWLADSLKERSQSAESKEPNGLCTPPRDE